MRLQKKMNCVYSILKNNQKKFSMLAGFFKEIEKT